MRLFLIRHAETEHNVSQVLAGVTDSALTTHGVLQAKRLGAYFATNGIRFTTVFSSDLQRTVITAGEIVNAQFENSGAENGGIQRVQLPLLREQDFGSREGTLWNSRIATASLLDETHPDFRPKETHEAMSARMDTFIQDFMAPLLAVDAVEPQTVAVVSHGIILSVLWRCMIKQFPAGAVSLGPEAPLPSPQRPVEYLPGWTNTGYLEIIVTPLAADAVGIANNAPLSRYKVRIERVNSKAHLSNMRRIPGVGSSTFDARQKDITTFFQKK